MPLYFLLCHLKSRFNIKRNKENEEYFFILNKIFKKEKIEMNLKFATMFYKKLHKKRENYKKVMDEINNELSFNETVKIQNTTNIK